MSDLVVSTSTGPSQEQADAQAAQLASRLVVLKAIAKQGWFWPSEDQ